MQVNIARRGLMSVLDLLAILMLKFSHLTEYYYYNCLSAKVLTECK